MIYLGADHRGFEMKNKIKKFLEELGYAYEDLGASIYNKEDDYPDFAKAVAKKVSTDAGRRLNRGILICGSGVGIAVSANKIRGVRAGTILKPEQVRAAVNDEDLNILSLAADFLSEEEAKEIVRTFLETKFSGQERHKRRIEKIDS
jgi:ribose 5-phosphate isomerase B